MKPKNKNTKNLSPNTVTSSVKKKNVNVHQELTSTALTKYQSKQQKKQDKPNSVGMSKISSSGVGSATKKKINSIPNSIFKKLIEKAECDTGSDKECIGFTAKHNNYEMSWYWSYSFISDDVIVGDYGRMIKGKWQILEPTESHIKAMDKLIDKRFKEIEEIEEQDRLDAIDARDYQDHLDDINSQWAKYVL
jgi:hypothetical protein